MNRFLMIFAILIDWCLAHSSPERFNLVTDGPDSDAYRQISSRAFRTHRRWVRWIIGAREVKDTIRTQPIELTG